MKPITVKQLVSIVDGTLEKGDKKLLLKGAVYRGDKLRSTHSIVFHRKRIGMTKEILEKFVPCVVVTTDLSGEWSSIEGLSIIAVNDIEKAFWKFVDYYRKSISAPVVAITGTCGKTTTKDMIVHILHHERNVQATRRSNNSRLMSLQYLLKMNRHTDVGVFETAVGVPGDLKTHLRYFKPDIGIITNIGVYHLDGCKTLEQYIAAKAEMLEGIAEGGTLFLNADDKNTGKIDLTKFKGRIVWFGVKNKVDFQAKRLRYINNGMSFYLITGKRSYPVFVPGYGEHQVYNALAALAAVSELGMEMSMAIHYLANFKNEEKHLEILSGIQGSTILDDTWSSAPLSIEAALNVLNKIGKGKQKAVLIADIKRLEDYSLQYHREVGDMIASSEVDVLLTVGEQAKEIGNRAREKGWQGKLFSFENIKGLPETIRAILNPDTILLFKSTKTYTDLIKIKDEVIIRH
ncbi:UDP-N-acetylmuramoyl-tripeptide--D-alanyl-D-alanine ligase [Bacillus sp. OV322]|uniref:Mur ligase family protein n=1 Tax=Bacillus sp. OV322 TaxID=1882764 RepID=UPI0008E6D1DB|nr:Mur ligase family protein [Bacillus sp. OV322]SFC10180.1 UDP-N-acetylmuramoyl-tripeptide--D-alanyl-D-alanine ligase [Bacillus sp. OV322]